jgi:hypothetical protein
MMRSHIEPRQKELDLAAIGATIQVERFTVGEQLEQVAQCPKPCAFVKAKVALVCHGGFATQAIDVFGPLRDDARLAVDVRQIAMAARAIAISRFCFDAAFGANQFKIVTGKHHLVGKTVLAIPTQVEIIVDFSVASGAFFHGLVVVFLNG